LAHQQNSERPTPAVLIVRDGWGRNPNPEQDAFNAVKQARTPACDKLLREYPWTLIRTSGEQVGLPEGTMGNSEVGHQNLGAGRIVDQESVRISKAIRTGEFLRNEVLVEAVGKAKTAGRAVHLLGLASDAGVHSLLDHLYACIELCKRMDQRKVYLHLFMDGRDTGPYTGLGFIKRIEAKCRQIGLGEVVTVSGRYYAMDRDNRWQRVAQAYACLTGRGGQAEGVTYAATATEAAQYYYDHPTNDSQNGDEFILPTIVGASRDAARQTRISDGDTVIFFNYRGDRPREITKAMVYDDAKWSQVPAASDTGQRGFDRGKRLDLHYVTLTAYEEGLPVHVAFVKPPKMMDIVGEYFAKLGLRQFRCAETEKFPHVTFFFNDYREQPFAGESWDMAPSPKVATYDLQPQMSAPAVCDIVLKRLSANDCEDFILVNFANGDMVGHSGKLDAAIKAIETADGCVGKIVDAALARGGVCIVTADHGNAEQMWDPETNSPHTAHTTYDVECMVIDPQKKNMASRSIDQPSTALRVDGTLADVMPTMLMMMGLSQPAAMTGRSLLER